MKTGLLPLIHPLKMTEFLSHFRNNEPFVVHHDSNEHLELRSFSLPNLLSSWTDSVQVHLPDLRDEASAVDVPAAEAKKMFEEGMGILFNDINRFYPLLQDWVDTLKSDLGISAQTYGRSLIYVTPDGKGTAPHFDQNINFVLQVSGTKTWTMGKNSSVMNPMVRHTMGQPVDPEMMSYLIEPMAEQMPAKIMRFELKPGSLLFVPRGMWHETQAEGEALSLNFTFTAPTWADLFLAALRSRLVLSPEWRESAVVSEEEKFASLLESLKEELPHWNASDILEATET